MAEAKVKPTSVRLPPDLANRLRTVAARERRSVTAQIIVCVERCLDSLPLQPAQPDARASDRTGHARMTADTPAPYPGKASSSSSSGAGGE